MSPEEAAFAYELPRELIAQEPLPQRVDARLMLVDRQQQSIDHYHIRDLPDVLRAGDRLVLNDTRVIAARLVGLRTLTGGRWQGLFLEASPDGRWRILQKTRGTMRSGETVTLQDRNGRPTLSLTLIEPASDGQWWARVAGQQSQLDVIDRIGRVPLPPYIRGGQMVDADIDRYQTVFARYPGAVAAPTAGLHFSKELLRSLEHFGMSFSAVTLHVGLDTFRPISTPTLAEHHMHSEWCELSQHAAQDISRTRSEEGRIVAVGTTCVRVLETAAQATNLQKSSDDPSPDAAPDPVVAPWSGETSLFICPPYKFRAVDVLLTNFHFPRTTLLVLVSAFGGRDLIARAYEEAIRERYRFYSYGDAMLIV